MNFDKLIDRRGTESAKWDLMEKSFGVSPDDGLAMWVADMDFEAPDFLQKAVRGLIDKANYGYFAGIEGLETALTWWLETRHDWKIDPTWITLTGGLGNGIAMALQTFTQPDDVVVTFTPVYHEFEVKIGKTGRKNLQLPLVQDEHGLYRMDFAAYESQMTGAEKLVLISHPHNPAGRVWSVEELKELAEFCVRHDLLLISDEIHSDLILPGHKHMPMHIVAPEIENRLIAMTSASKTFNIAGGRTGFVIIPDADLRNRFRAFHRSLDLSPNLLGVVLSRAAFSPEGAAWVDALCGYLDGNAALFNEQVSAIPGLKAMPMQSTYLAWVDFAGTGMSRDEFHDRVYRKARIAATPGHTLGKGGESFLRFNLGTQRVRVEEAAARLAEAFSDLQ
ncbi:MalY/PatB family protein [Shimia biformata]|uniref:MalY/PatB family protein n=1 Tax=Shimia biformata TaxID=1294299 RepID=UPI00194F4567|nr:PatB family C-S lyase [Shimia biformata]